MSVLFESYSVFLVKTRGGKNIYLKRSRWNLTVVVIILILVVILRILCTILIHFTRCAMDGIFTYTLTPKTIQMWVSQAIHLSIWVCFAEPHFRCANASFASQK